MTIPVEIGADLAAFLGAVQAAAPLANATKITLNALTVQGQALVAEIDAATQAAGAPLDAGEPSGFAGSLPGALLSLFYAAADETTLSDLRGLVGRALFNLQQAGAA